MTDNKRRYTHHPDVQGQPGIAHGKAVSLATPARRRRWKWVVDRNERELSSEGWA